MVELHPSPPSRGGANEEASARRLDGARCPDAVPGRRARLRVRGETPLLLGGCSSAVRKWVLRTLFSSLCAMYRHSGV